MLEFVIPYNTGVATKENIVDILIWEHEGMESFIASPVSSAGAIALTEYLFSRFDDELPDDVALDHAVGCCPIEVTPFEFVAHLPLALGVFIIIPKTFMVMNVRNMTKKNLQ